jgi:hypothetical protein
MEEIHQNAKQESGEAAGRSSLRAEQDLISHLQNGYQIETDSLGGNPAISHRRNETRSFGLRNLP